LSKGTELKLSTTTRAAAVSAALAGSLALAACGASNEGGSGNTSAGSGSSAAQLSGELVGAGSSAQQAAMQAWQAGFNAEQPGVTFSYDPVGSGGGREQFLAGGTDFAGSDSAMTDAELASAADRCGTSGVFELPNYISAIAVVYNLDGVTDLNLSPATLAGIFSGAITTWNDPKIAADNPDATLPSTAITPVHRGDKSGTTKNFGIAKIKVGDTFVAPSPEGAAAVVANSERVAGRGEYDLAVSVNRTTTSADEYPVVLVSYHIGCIEYDDQAKADAVKAFESYVVSPDGQKAAADNAGSSPITDDARTAAQTVIDAITVAA
jgi:phosphate transport system substrate-binding protein